MIFSISKKLLDDAKVFKSNKSNMKYALIFDNCLNKLEDILRNADKFNDLYNDKTLKTKISGQNPKWKIKIDGFEFIITYGDNYFNILEFTFNKYFYEKRLT